MAYQLLVLDLDGTVLSRDLIISPVVVEAIQRARERGVIVTIATGRVYSSAVQFLPALGIDQPIICFQGALVRDPQTGTILYEAGLGSDRAVEALQHLQAAGVETVLFHGEDTVVGRWSPELDLYLSFHPGAEADVRIVPDLIHYARANPPIKLLFSTHPDKLDEAVSSLSDASQGRMSVVRSHMHFGEVTAPGVDKGSAIRSLAEHLGVQRENVIAIGDEENDLPMLTWAGLGLAVGNAPDSVRSSVQEVLPSIADDGVATAIERYILGDQVRYCNAGRSDPQSERQS